MSHGPSASGGAALKTRGEGHATEQDYQPVFVGEARAKLEDLLTRYPTRQAGLLPALWMVQEARGWVSEAGMAEVASVLGVTPAYVKGVVTFYTMYHQHPVGKYLIQVCTTTPCHVCGAEDVVKAFLERTKCSELGVTSEDGRYTVIEVECLGACGFATPVMVNADFIESVSADRVPDVLARYT